MLKIKYFPCIRLRARLYVSRKFKDVRETRARVIIFTILLGYVYTVIIANHNK